MDEVDRVVQTEIEKRHETRRSIMALQHTISKTEGHWEGDSDNCPLTHFFAPGVYVRQIFVPAGTTVVTKIHRYSHVAIVAKGRVHVVTEDGTEIIEAPHTWVVNPSGKKAVYHETDTIWITVHPTEETDLAKIERDIISEDFLDDGSSGGLKRELE